MCRSTPLYVTAITEESHEICTETRYFSFRCGERDFVREKYVLAGLQQQFQRVFAEDSHRRSLNRNNFFAF